MQPTPISATTRGEKVPSVVQVKGLSMVAFQRALTELKGDDAMTRVFARIRPDLAKALQQGEVLAMGWYPLAWFAELHTAAQAEFGAPISSEIGRTATRHDVTTLYRFILKFLAPDTLMKHYGRVFALFCESGKVVVEENIRGRARVRCSGLLGASRGVWEDIVGSTEVILGLCGAKSPAGRLLGGTADGEMTFEFTWS